MAKKVTIENKLTEQLGNNGHDVVLSRSTKYRVFESDTPGEFYFVGRAGALRRGRTVTESHSLEGPIRDRLIAQWDAAHSKKEA